MVANTEINKTLHIVSGLAAAGTMKLYLKGIDSNDKIALWEAPFTYGPLFRDFSDKELKRRTSFFYNFFGHYEYDLYPAMHNIINRDFGKYQKVVVWHGDGVDECLLLYMICSLTEGQVYEADITELYELFPHFKSTPFPLALAHCSVDNIRIMYDKIKPVPEEAKARYISEWHKWSKSDAPLRLIDNDNTIFEAGEDYFDNLILSVCSTDYTKAARIIGEVLFKSNQLIGDGFLHKRVIWLIRQNKLQACNNKEATTEIEESNCTDANKIVVNGVNVTCMRFISVRLSQ